MSRAFVKEPDGDSPGDDTPERPISRQPNYITPQGLARLRTRQAEFKAEHERLTRAPETPGLKLERDHLARELRYLEGRIERAVAIDPAGQPQDEVAFGAEVEVREEGGARRRVRIVGEDEAEAEAGRVSVLSPLARALIGARVGDVILWQRPAGDRELEVLGIRYPRG